MKNLRFLAVVFILQIIAWAQPASLRLEVTGDVAKPVVYEEAQWKQLQHVSLTATNQHDKKTATYSGVRLQDLLKDAGVPNGESLRGKVLTCYVLVSAADGYQVVFSLAELDESIGNQQVLMADAEDGKPLQEGTGPLRLVVPGDKRPARWVRMVKTIRVIANPSSQASSTGTEKTAAPILQGWSAPLQSTDIGNPAIQGSTQAISGGLEITAAGKDIWGASDEFHFTYQKQTGDFDVIARVESLNAPHLYSRAGLMVREDLSPDSRHVFFLVFPDNRPRHNNTSAYELQYREQKSGGSKAIYPPQNTDAPAFPVSFPQAWLRLQRTGNQFTGFTSNDGKVWKTYSTYSLDLPATVLLGLAVTSHTAQESTTATFKDFRHP